MASDTLRKKKLEKATQSKNTLMAKRAKLAETLAKLRHKK